MRALLGVLLIAGCAACPGAPCVPSFAVHLRGALAPGAYVVGLEAGGHVTECAGEVLPECAALEQAFECTGRFRVTLRCGARRELLVTADPWVNPSSAPALAYRIDGPVIDEGTVPLAYAESCGCWTTEQFVDL